MDKDSIVVELVDRVRELEDSLRKAEVTMQIILKNYFRHASNADPLIVKAIILNEHNRFGVLAEIVEDNLCSMRTTISLDINDLVKHLKSVGIEQSTKGGPQHG